MNTHDIELPPLPKASKMYDIPGYDEEELKDYARAAIEADRNRRGEPVGYIMPTALKQLRAGGNAIVGGLPQGGDVAVYLAPQPAEPVKSTCKKCNGTGVESTRFHGVWPNGEECLEPIKCYQCDGFGTTSVAEPVKVPSNTDIDELSREWGLQSAAYPSKSMVRDFARALLARYGNTQQEQP